MATYVRLGIIGLGRVFDQQREALALVPQLSTEAACDINPSMANKIRPPTRFYSDIDTFLDAEHYDVLLISVPPDWHHEIARRSLLKGKHIILEKPACQNLSDLQELIDLSRRLNRIFYISGHAAFAPETLWFAEYCSSKTGRDLGPLDQIRCFFSDPYIVENQLLSYAALLGGSWMDSGINGLSVADHFIDLSTAQLEMSSLTRVEQFSCKEIQGSVSYCYRQKDGAQTGRLFIDTNWTLGLNLKLTRLQYLQSKKEILLHHSGQSVYEIDSEGSVKLMASCGHGRPRLVNHYIGVFKDFHLLYSQGLDNAEHQYELHELFFKVYENSPFDYRYLKPS